MPLPMNEKSVPTVLYVLRLRLRTKHMKNALKNVMTRFGTTYRRNLTNARMSKTTLVRTTCFSPPKSNSLLSLSVWFLISVRLLWVNVVRMTQF